MKTRELVPLEPNQIHKHNYIKKFFLDNLEYLEKIYLEINGSLKVNAENWQRYTNSKELFRYVYPAVCLSADFTLDTIAYSESAEFIGNEMRTDKGEKYLSMPVGIHDKMLSIGDNLYIVEHAIFCFITMLNQMFFKHLYKKPFMILREVDGMGIIWVELSDDLKYVIVD